MKLLGNPCRCSLGPIRYNFGGTSNSVLQDKCYCTNSVHLRSMSRVGEHRGLRSWMGYLEPCIDRRYFFCTGRSWSYLTPSQKGEFHVRGSRRVSRRKVGMYRPDSAMNCPSLVGRGLHNLSMAGVLNRSSALRTWTYAWSELGALSLRCLKDSILAGDVRERQATFVDLM